MPPLKITGLGSLGVNVDKAPRALDDLELRQAQNAIHEPLGTKFALVNRPGLIDITSGYTASGAVLGGISAPLLDTSDSGSVGYFIGRGDTL